MFESMHEMLASLHQEMRPLSGGMVTVARWIGGIGAYLYLFLRLGKHMARAEAIDFFPLLKPFAIALAITFYPFTLSMIELMVSPAIVVTETMVEGQHKHIERLQIRKEAALAKEEENQLYEDDDKFREELDQYGITELGSKVGLYLNKASYDIKKYFRLFIKELLELLYYTAALLINLARTIFLVVLEITGPIPLALSILPGFASSFTSWMGRYINVYMWLAVTNIYGSIIGKIQVFMLEQDISRIEAGTESFILEDLGTMMFLLLAIGGYCMVPAATSWMISASGVGNAMSAVSGMASKALKSTKKALKSEDKSKNLGSGDPQITGASINQTFQRFASPDSQSYSSASSKSGSSTNSNNSESSTSSAKTPSSNEKDTSQDTATTASENSTEKDTTSTANQEAQSQDNKSANTHSENADATSTASENNTDNSGSPEMVNAKTSESQEPSKPEDNSDPNPSQKWKYYHKYNGDSGEGNNESETSNPK